MREASHILLEGTPVGIDVEEVVARMRSVEGVNDVHHLHVWAICSHISVLSAHVDLLPEYRLRQGLFADAHVFGGGRIETAGRNAQKLVPRQTSYNFV